jgi:dipeptidyl aminopeptidase/acylaminoacyl peptidase
MTHPTFLDQLLQLPTVTAAFISPDQRWVAFNWYRIHANQDVFLVPADGSQPPVPLTHTPEATTFVSWTPDSRAVLVAEDHDRDERTRLFRVSLDQPKLMDPLTEDRPPYFLRGGELHPDGHTLFYGANFDFDTGQKIEPTWIYRHDLESGQRLVIARPQVAAWTLPSLNRAGTHLLYQRRDRHPAGRQFYLVDIDGQQDREIINFGDRVKTFARWFPDSHRILVLSESVDGTPQDYQSLGIYDLGTGEMRWMIDDPERSLESAWVTPDGLVVVDEMRSAGHHCSWIDPATGLESAFPQLAGNLLPLGRLPEKAGWVGMYYSARLPTELVRFDHLAADPTELVSLTHVWERTTLDPAWLVGAEPFSWQSVDGFEVQGWLYRAHPNPRRAIVYIHGGPSSHSEDKLNPQLQYFVSRGFNVLDVNYRGSTGFGLKYREAIKEDGWGGREQSDIAAGAQALIDLGLALPGRIGVSGTSYGGYSAWFLITHYPPEIIGASAPICGMTDLVVDYQTTRPDLRPLSEEMLGGTPETAPERYFERSPLNFVENIRGKLLIVQGAQDPNVTPENVRQVVTRLEQYSVPYEILVFEDEGHGIGKPANQKVLYERLAAFFDQALGESAT